MRYKLTLSLSDQHQNILPINYQYELSCWFFKLFNTTDATFLKTLSEKGYLDADGKYRAYVFSHLLVPDRLIEKDRILLMSECVNLIFSTFPDETLTPLIIKKFLHQQFLLGDKISQVPFVVEQVERMAEPLFNDKMTFRTLSPIFLSREVLGRKLPEYLSPEQPEFVTPFWNNLHDKYRRFKGVDHPQDVEAAKFKLRSEVKKKGITIKTGTLQQLKYLGYHLRFRLNADPDLLRIGYYLGFGEKNSLGFGCCDAL